MLQKIFAGAALAACASLALAPAALAQRAQAVPGRPFGVAHIALELPAAASDSFIRARGFSIQEANGRVFYPAFSVGGLGDIAAELFGGDVFGGSNRLTVSFLFTGEAPLDVTVFTPTPQRVRITPTAPRRDRRAQQRLTRWWRAYHAQAREQRDQGDAPPLLETYLTEMLAGRLGLDAPLLSRRRERDVSELQQSLELLIGAEAHRDAVMRAMMRGQLPVEPRDQPVPVGAARAAPTGISAGPQVDLEPLATRVPEDCFYIRFGSFSNYLWLNHLQKDYGGNIGQMVSLRSYDARLSEKLKSQLAIRESATAEMFGPQIIEDVALIGRDLYLREGAAVGILFQAKNSDVLKASLEGDRRQALREQEDQGASLTTATLAGHKVSFLSTPDNRLRSYYAVDGDFHLVTTSRAIVERFLETGAGGGGRAGSLAGSAAFQHARRTMPLTRDDTIFGYFSPEFFAALASPDSQIELSRRLQSVVWMDVAQLAQLAAIAEGQPHETIADLVRGGFLPPTLLGPDGGAQRVAEVGERDPLRGARGSFLPVPDVDLTELSRSELAAHGRAARIADSSLRVDPLMFAVRRYAREGERMERIVVEANVSPLVEEKYGWLLSLIGPPADVVVQAHPDEVISAQMSLQGGLLWPDIPAHQLFLGLRDARAGSDVIPSGFLQTVQTLRTAPGYIGAWPQLGLLDRLPLFLSPPPDPQGFSRLPLGLWRWQGDGFSVLSFDPELLTDAANQLQVAPAENLAQIRVRIGDLAQSELAGWISGLNYTRAYQASLGNARLAHMLSQQLRIAPEEGLATAERLLDAELVCTLGGEYEYHPGSSSGWVSTAWPGSDRVPSEFAAPLLDWFRGARIDLNKHPSELALRVELDMQRKERDAAPPLPLFDLFGRGKATE